MNATELDLRINGFLERKFATYPDLAVSGRYESRTIKYAHVLRASGQLLLSR
jgi:hypothetical protein